MSKFNTAATIKTENLCGHPAYSMSDKAKLITQVLTSFFNESKFYGDNTDDMIETVKRVIKTDPKFVSNLAIFARREFNMRSVSHALCGQLAHEVEGKPFVKRTLKGIVLRGDDATEVLAYYLNTFGKPIPNSLRRGLRDIFATFDQYTLAKYKGEGNTVKMRDILCLCRPKPRDDAQSKLWKDLLEGKLAPAYTWETELSRKGNKKETWEELIASKRLPYMAALRNLRNIVKAEPDNIGDILNILADPEIVRKSKQLPFRYMSAYRENQFAGSRILNTLEDAADAAVNNLPKIPGRTVIAIDTSGSMSCRVSSKSDVRCCDIAMLLGLIANRICEDAIVYTFDTDIRQLNVNARGGLLHNAINLSACGGGTDMGLPFEKMLREHVKCDRVIILSDNQCNSGNSWYRHKTVESLADEYRKQSGNDIWVHAVDLEGYGTQQFDGAKTNIISGWSEKVFDFILLAEKGVDTLEKRIENYKFGKDDVEK